MTSSPAPRRGLLRRLAGDRSGAIAMILALALPLLLGFTALGVEAGLWYVLKTQNQSAVDSAALTGAIALSQFGSNPTSAQQTAIAQQAAYDAHANSANVDPTVSATYTTTCPPSAVNQICAQQTTVNGFQAVQVELSQQVHTTFADLFTLLVGAEKSTLALNTKAKAGLQALLGKAGACMNTAGQITVSGTATLTLPNCGVLSYATNCPQPTSNLAVGVTGASASLTAGGIISEGCVGATGSGAQINVPTGSILQQVKSTLMPQKAFTDSSGNPPADPYYAAAGNWPTASVTATATSSTGSTVLNFASVPAIVRSSIAVGMPVSDVSHSGGLDSRAVVASATATTVTLGGTGNPIKGSFHNNDTISFGAVPTITWTTGTLTLSPGFYQGLSISGGTVNLSPGTYYFSNGSNWKCPAGNNGDGLCVSGGTLQQATGTTGAIEIVFDALNLNISGGNFSLPSVTMLLTSQAGGTTIGSISITGGTGTMTAPSNGGTACTAFTASGCSFSTPTALPASFSSTTADTVNGILVYQNPNYNSKNTINVEGAASSCASSTALILSGAIDSGYTSTAEDDVSGSGSNPCGTCTELIAGSFKYSGSVALDTSGCTDTFGQITAQVYGIGLVE